MMPSQFGWARPNMDGWAIAGDHTNSTSQAKYRDVPVLVGYNSDEGLLFGNPKSQEAYVQSVRERYREFADKILAVYSGVKALLKSGRRAI